MLTLRKAIAFIAVILNSVSVLGLQVAVVPAVSESGLQERVSESVSPARAHFKPRCFQECEKRSDAARDDCNNSCNVMLHDLMPLCHKACRQHGCTGNCVTAIRKKCGAGSDVSSDSDCAYLSECVSEGDQDKGILECLTEDCVSEGYPDKGILECLTEDISVLGFQALAVSESGLQNPISESGSQVPVAKSGLLAKHSTCYEYCFKQECGKLDENHEGMNYCITGCQETCKHEAASQVQAITPTECFQECEDSISCNNNCNVLFHLMPRCAEECGQRCSSVNDPLCKTGCTSNCILAIQKECGPDKDSSPESESVCLPQCSEGEETILECLDIII